MTRTIGLAAMIVFLISCGGGDGDKVIVVGDQGPRMDHRVAAIADFNGDGFNDLIVARSEITAGPNANPDHLDVYLQDAGNPGTFRSPSSDEVGENMELTTLSAVDIQLDGLPDTVAASLADGQLHVHLQQSGTGLEGAGSYSSGSGSGRHAIADINMDGLPDMAAVGGDEVTYWVQNSAEPGRFGARQTLGVGTQDVAIADIDGDGLPDIATFGVSQEYDIPENLLWYRQDPMLPGSFLTPQVLAMGDTRGRDLIVADLDGNGRLDLITSGSKPDGFAFDWYLVVFSQDAAGSFNRQRYRTPDLSILWGNMRVAHLDQDGRADIAVAGTSRVYLFHQSASGSLSRGSSIRPPTDQAVSLRNWVNLDTGDLNMDGLDDIVLTNNELSVAFQQPSGGFAAPVKIADQR